MKIQYSLFDTLLEPVFVLNAEQKVVYCNEPAAIICGLSIRKITRGMKFLELFELSEPLEGLNQLLHISDPTPYKEVNFKTSQGGEGKVQITLQPIFDSMGDKNWIVFVRDVTLEERLQKKYRAELEQKEDVIKDLEDAKSQLENYSKNLEKMVADRTAEIQRMNQMMTALLDSLHQGFFIFNAEGKVLEVSSKACESTIECRPQGQNIWDVLKLPEKKVEGFQKWMQTMFMEMLPFEDLAPLGPPTYPHSQDRNISLEYFPLRSAPGTGSEGAMEGIVVVASDITSLVEAQKQAERDREYAKLIINLVQNKKEIGRFIRESQALLADLQIGLQSSWEHADSEFLFRQLHTLKGGAALFSIQDMAEHCHSAETMLAEFKEVASAEKFNALKEQSLHIASSFAGFIQKSEEVLGSSAMASERQLEIPVSKFQSALTKIEAKVHNNEVTQILLSEFAMESVGSFFSSYNEVAQRVASSQEKQLNPVEFTNADLKVLPEVYSSLFATFVHSFRNSVDHGIESPFEREEKGKPSAGTIKVHFSLLENNSRLLIRIDDDGQGVNPAKIREKLAKKNIDTSKESDHEVIQHIFDSQFSTRDQVTETSGRGVGMDAIKYAAEELNGRCWVESTYEKGTSLFVEVPYITNFYTEKKKSLKAA
ncbi:ATP-binding protein [Bdellovibrio svalbardensis]|uniref:histidine kinase n=1 Tax=Bdellovibrio svalbardensis TaxID=2972972 RepID=A0ABT6DH17_9BACT|nr:ATP-binding protein [Bdellovibrio svalbardensis]MDG0816157.1 ATP-binding protein [Bdellovibrio svalbardensis]